MTLPKYITYRGHSWHVTQHGPNQVKLWIIGFQNQHTLVWGRSVLAANLADGTATVERMEHYCAMCNTINCVCPGGAV